MAGLRVEVRNLVDATNSVSPIVVLYSTPANGGKPALIGRTEWIRYVQY